MLSRVMNYDFEHVSMVIGIWLWHTLKVCQSQDLMTADMSCGDCLAHVGEAENLANRIPLLARLGVHHGAINVLCAAYSSGQRPLVRWW
jgi:hypothetical protein